jgi:hypothetical protein
VTTTPSLLSATELHDFTSEEIAKTPIYSGVYILFRRGHILDIDQSRDLRESLSGHQRGDGGARTRCATHFRWERVGQTQLEQRKVELVSQYRMFNNSNVPVGNRMDVTTGR